MSGVAGRAAWWKSPAWPQKEVPARTCWGGQAPADSTERISHDPNGEAHRTRSCPTCKDGEVGLSRRHSGERGSRLDAEVIALATATATNTIHVELSTRPGVTAE